jgi:hypothetical protein
MSRRIFSEKYVDRRIAEIDEMHKRTQTVPAYPRCMDVHNPNNVFGHTKLSRSEVEEIKAYLKWVRERAIVDGFWAGWTLREGSPSCEK